MGGTLRFPGMHGKKMSATVHNWVLGPKLYFNPKNP